MKNRTCRYCKKQKPIAEFQMKHNGNIRKTCHECWIKSYTVRQNAIKQSAIQKVRMEKEENMKPPGIYLFDELGTNQIIHDTKRYWFGEIEHVRKKTEV